MNNLHEKYNSKNLNFLKLILSLVLWIIFANIKTLAQDIDASKITFSESDLKNGFFIVTIPVYDDDGYDEGIPPTSGAGILSVNNRELLRFWTFKGSGDPQGEASWYWIHAQRITNEAAIYIHNTYGEDRWVTIEKVSQNLDVNNYENINITKSSSTTWAEIKVCLPISVLTESTLSFKVKYYIDVNENSDWGESSKTENLTTLTFPTPALTSNISNIVGKYDISTTVSSTNEYSIYEYSIDNSGYVAFTTSPVTIPVDVTAAEQNKTINIRYTLGSCGQKIVKSNSITLPAYPQATNFSATQQLNGDVFLNWNAIPQTGLCLEGDQFEIQRANNSNFSNPVTIGKVDYNKNSSSYALTDQVSKENLNGVYYYRIRRTKTENLWGWNYSTSTQVNLVMTHRYIASANVRFIQSSNTATVTWNYNSGNIWSANTTVVLERYNQTLGGFKEVITIPADSAQKRSYSERLTQLCNKFSYKIYVKPGSTNYTSQDPLSVGGDNVVPVEGGKLLSIKASKGFFSDRVELTWQSDGKPIDYYILKSRQYQSGYTFKQIARVEGAKGSETFLYNDEQAIPGIIYEYQLIGLINCADVTKYTDTLHTYGFRTPTGDVYGRVTFQNGQAEKDVEVRLETDAGIPGQSLLLDTTNSAAIKDTTLLENITTSLTLQAWISPDRIMGTRKIISKSSMYELGISNNFFYLSVGSQTIRSSVSVSSFNSSSGFIHISGVYGRDSLFIYINGQRIESTAFSGAISGNMNPVIIGGNFKGAIDEVRIWERALTELEINRDYNRYLTGGEDGLIAYWTFNYATNHEFYDCSYKNNIYNENHGSVNGNVLSNSRIPTTEQLCYKGVTDEDGSYAIRAIPYTGNGTPYTIIPRLGIHQFEPQEELRFIGMGAQTFTVNFTDKSSFRVTGTVTYQGGTYPVKGVSFIIDGVTALSKTGQVITTDDKGEFEIQVPVGSHEVIAQKNNHVFFNGGKITDSNGQNYNFQDEKTGIQLSDITKIRYIGRVAGGAVQASYPLGHSLSTNNLADGIKVILISKNQAYNIASKDTTLIFQHKVPSAKFGTNWSKSDSVKYSQKNITIYPNHETGEFIAQVMPETFTVILNVPGHDDIPGSNEDLNLSQSFSWETEIYNYTDSLISEGNWVKEQYSDTVYYQKAQKFIKRYPPMVRISQVNPESNKLLPYFGNDTVTINLLDGTLTKIPLYNPVNLKYALNHPVFTQGSSYKLKAEIFEKYTYYNSDGTVKNSRKPDEIPTLDARVNFNNNIAIPSDAIKTVEANENGIALYTFKTGEPELTSALRRISATISYGNEATATTIPWTEPFNAIVLGYKKTGTNFVTAGPDKIITVLRDPPGSKSYSFLEKGTTHKEIVKYTGSISNIGEEAVTVGFKASTFTWTGVGTGTMIATASGESGVRIGIEHEEEYKGEDTKSNSTTITTRFQTSGDPGNVGADADVFIGNSTNISYGLTNNVSIISKRQFGDGTGYQLYSSITPLNGSDWYLVRNVGLGVAQTFGTLFAYTQKHIEKILIPELTNIRNNLLMQPGLYTDEQLKAIATSKDTVLVVSKLTAGNPNYGKSNSDPVFNNPNFAGYDGPSYKIIFPENYRKSKNDTILFLNQSVSNWIKKLSENEEAKVNAKLLQNYSFEGGSKVEYSEAYATSKSHESTFHIMIGANIGNDSETTLFGANVKFQFKESVKTTHGGTWSSEEEAKHSKGFVLDEDGSDYISVDVCREKDWDDSSEQYGTGNLSEGNDPTLNSKDNFSSFIFRTRAGATSCPYEDAYVAKYFEPEKKHVIDEATMRIEVPEIAVEKDYIENVPSGEPAYFNLYLRNNSEISQDNWYTLKIASGSNPYGAKMFIDGAPIGNGLDFLVPSGGTLRKTLEVNKGSVMNYDKLKLILESKCEPELNDTLIFSVHYAPSCTNVEIKKPGDLWTYNTKLPVVTIADSDQHYLEVQLSGFDVNYDNFDHLKLQYKSVAESEQSWKTLMNFYNDSTLYKQGLENGNAAMINSADAGTLKFMLKMDDLPDQLYNLRAVSVCNINNEKFENYSKIISGIKDMFSPRLFGSPQPADGLLTIDDQIMLKFNEPIAEGLLTKNNFQVTGIRNGASSDHSVSVSFDGINDFMETEFEKNMAAKDIAMEMWININQRQNATLFNHGNINESIGISITENNTLKVFIGNKQFESIPLKSELGSWAHVAFIYSVEGYLSAYYNFIEVISKVAVGEYNGIGNMVIGKNIAGNNEYFKGKIHNLRVWNTIRSNSELQVKSLAKLSGTEPGLLAYYPMDRGLGEFAEDMARGANLIMKGCNWTVPEGRSIRFNGTNSYLKINTGSSVVIRDDMDYTIEFWFKGAPGQSNATLISNGRGDGNELGGSKNLIWIGFDSSGLLTFRNNGFTTTTTGNFLDNNWHHFALNVGRTIGRSQIYIDGNLVNYFSTENLGGIAAATMTVGAREWKEQGVGSSSQTDYFFNGFIDELRIWNLYKYEDQIKESLNTKLNGDEIGLVAYYPFENYKVWQGLKELRFTLSDNKIQKDPSNHIADAVKYNANETNDIPPVKDIGPVSNLKFDFVVNNDALIIYLDETPEKIEKTIVTFTVDGVQDKNGNENVSPFTWSAYIDRNMLRWGEPVVNVTKQINQKATFSVQMVNKSGAFQNFNIRNYPSWMKVTPASGRIAPNSSIMVTFEVDEGLNTGTYNEMISLINNDNVSEVLEVNVKAKGESPEWKVNPGDFEFNMHVYAKLRINNLFSKDPEDKIAAFADGKCIGVANVQYEKRNDMWYAFLVLYSNTASKDGIVFKIWDSSTGTVFFANPATGFSFVNNGTAGSPATPLVFNANSMIFQKIDLNEGWNWISFNVNSSNLSDLNDLLADMNWTSGDFFKSEIDNLSANYSGNERRWVTENTLSLNNLYMYKLKSGIAQSLEISGTKIKPSDMPIDVSGNQWNYIGYLPQVRLKIDEALAGYDAAEEDVVKSQDGFAMFSGNIGWVGNLTYMEPGKGYMIYRKTTGNTRLKFPDINGSLSVKGVISERTKEYVNHEYSKNMNFVVITNFESNLDDRILVYSGNELRAEVSPLWTENQQIYFITIPGEAGQAIRFELMQNGKITGRTNEAYPFVINSVNGTLYKPFLLNFSRSDVMLNVYPNPVRDEVNISLYSEKTSEVNIRITDISGRIVYSGIGSTLVGGSSTTLVDCSNFLPGIYFARITADGFTRVIKIEKL